MPTARRNLDNRTPARIRLCGQNKYSPPHVAVGGGYRRIAAAQEDQFNFIATISLNVLSILFAKGTGRVSTNFATPAQSADTQTGQVPVVWPFTGQ